jgi:ribosomal protein S27AE
MICTRCQEEIPGRIIAGHQNRWHNIYCFNGGRPWVTEYLK